MKIVYDYFIDENPDVKERVRKAFEKGRIEGWQLGVQMVAQERFPALLELAKERVQLIKEPDALLQLLSEVLKAPDEESARQLFLALGH